MALIKVTLPAGRKRNRSLKDYTGTRFGRLVGVQLLQRDETTENNHLWRFRCDCGAEKDARIKLVRSGNTTSCGCAFRDVMVERNTTHGLSRNPAYKIWKGMKARCNTPTNTDYASYGGRGIRVCERWSEFPNFLADMGERPEGHSIDRIDVNGHYEPSNCRWSPPVEQANNKRTSRLIEIGGEIRTLQQWSDHHGIGRSLVAWRMRQGWPIAEVFAKGDRRLR